MKAMIFSDLITSKNSIITLLGVTVLIAIFIAIPTGTLYGSIGAVIVVLIWLNLSAFTLILGAEMNGVLISMRKDRLEQDVNIPKT